MRRLAPSSVVYVALQAARAVHSVAVLQNASPATVAEKLGSPVPKEAVAAANKVPAAILEKACNPRLVAFTEMDLARARFAPLIASITAGMDFNHVEHQVASKFNADKSKLMPVPGALKKLRETQWKDMAAVITFYEETMYPIRMKHNEYKDYELTSFHIKDVLKRGLTAFKQDFLDQQKAELTKVKASMKACDDFVHAAVVDALDTAICNDIANILRIAGEQHPHAHRMALKILDDMNMMKIPYNAATCEILQATTFNDGPFDNSPLLFEVIEYPERGEVTIGAGSLESISGDILKLISNRHQTPLDDGVLLRSTETHPNLQRSPE
ncbi:putative mitochondrial hypothetical protein [Leptomonas pyrrhocoris]|uniref:Uncharacterized protein n=1 Tax=Leptomonas pyrrhocoris TaxID=157538 RepID=A0A0M9FXD7_LEPPY|nr:putative mitochondrial hypothetical protein [Leptomonas pyrrhocoris]XP_015656275.1 putative mitochondrial hypothetical protein [Leptomonas pyrrhocoris]XP_015656276.1 putative mitochondrial hypothetical protein [Leptomonas pyrrhocoris]KPA77835.1 putative mitochondrial hypothetical protein [Leptomonas pyrrhocoris]KPA77836.1 putative mitochondrial hypothetical protein [Leptomonas pyrrhocoris]KPA77837.1 putative mitochondrial hypothetical protein [Leptomonas pyrrhocoris]|eukprot:XP_015656274.1 putative mitochondrial hypothetical protein [Leptomonas pyrrhocoris]